MPKAMAVARNADRPAPRAGETPEAKQIVMGDVTPKPAPQPASNSIRDKNIKRQTKNPGKHNPY